MNADKRRFKLRPLSAFICVHPRLILSFAVFLSHVALAQSRPPFATADVHASAPGTREEGGFLPEGRFECRGATMLKLIATAYHVDANLVAGGPDWLASDRFDIMARAPSRRASEAALREMLRSLLAERFGLAVHEERKGARVYLLKVDEKGPKLRAATDSEAPECPKSAGGDPGLNHRACRAFSMADLSRLLPQVARNYADLPVVDATGLTGRYDFQLDWMSRPEYLGAKADADGPAAVSLLDALAKLGLKLEPGTRPTRAIAIDRLNRLPADVSRGTSEEPAAAAREFDVAEVLPSKLENGRELKALPSGQLEIRGYTLRELLKIAFEVQDKRIAGGPKWLDEQRFDVVEKSPDAMSPRAVSGMLKTLLVERFKLETHTEDQPVPVFALTTGKRPPKLKRTAGTARSECSLKQTQKGRAYACRNTTMAQLVERLPSVAQAYIVQPLVDLTGLKDAYDFTLNWTPKSRLSGVAVGGGDAGSPQAVFQPSAGGNDLTIFEAIQKQLGLKIEERKYPMPAIIVDRVQPLAAGDR